MIYSIRLMVRKRRSTETTYLPQRFDSLAAAINQRDLTAGLWKATNPGTVVLVCSAESGDGVSCVGQEHYEHLYRRL